MMDETDYPLPNFNNAIVEVLEMDKQSCLTHYNVCNYLSKMVFKSNHVSKTGPKSLSLPIIIHDK